MIEKDTPMRLTMILAAYLSTVSPARLAADDWQTTTTAELAKKEKPGFGGVCGVLVDRATGHVFIDLSDSGGFSSTEPVRSWGRERTPVQRHSTHRCAL